MLQIIGQTAAIHKGSTTKINNDVAAETAKVSMVAPQTIAAILHSHPPIS
jgi:hypothetical protein